MIIPYSARMCKNVWNMIENGIYSIGRCCLCIDVVNEAVWIGDGK